MISDSDQKEPAPKNQNSVRKSQLFLASTHPEKRIADLVDKNRRLRK